MVERMIPYKELKALCSKKLIEAGILAEDAELTADVLVHANLRGADSHGVMRTEHYVKWIRAGGINPVPEIKIKDTGPSSAIVDGDDGLGHVISVKAMERAIDLAKKMALEWLRLLTAVIAVLCPIS